MINKNNSIIPSFVSQAQLLVPIIHRQLSGHSDQKIVINKSLLSQKPLIVPIEEADSYCITLEDFLDILDTRIKAEFSYRDEIIDLKDHLCEEFDMFYNGTTDKDLVKHIRDQRQRMVNAVVDQTKIEEKMIVEEFYNDMINGWDEKALNLENFDKIAYAALWKPLLTPFPNEALDKLRGLIKELGKERSTLKMEETITKFINYIQIIMEEKEIKDNSFKSNKELREELEKLCQERKICKVIVYDVLKNGNIIEEFRGKCIENVMIVGDAKIFLDADVKMNYEEVMLEDVVIASNFIKLLDNIQIKVKSLEVRFGEGNLEDYKKMGERLSKFKHVSRLNLGLQHNEIEKEGAIVVSNALKELKNVSNLALNLANNNIKVEGINAVSTALKDLKKISILNLGLRNNNIGADGAHAISIALKELKNISTLCLNLELNNIGDEGVNAVSTALKEMKNISILNLSLECNNIEDAGAKAVSIALQELKNISSLNVNFNRNNVCNDGFKAISAALIELTNVSTLDLNFSLNNIWGEGATAISAPLKELKHISILSLQFRENSIGDDGAKSVSTALKEMKNISTLHLNFQECNIGEEGAKAIFAAFEKPEKKSTLHLNIQDNSIGEEGEAALQKFKIEFPNYNVKYQI